MALAPSEKCISHGDKNYKSRYIDYYLRHSTTSGRAHRETVTLEEKQRYTPGEKDMGTLLKEEEHRKEAVKLFT